MRLSWPEKAKLPQPFVASKAEYRLSLSGCVTQSTFVVYLQQWVKGTALSYVWWWGARRRAVVGRRLCCLPELSLLIFSWAGNTILFCYFLLVPGPKARSSAGINPLYFTVAEGGRRMHSGSGYNLPCLETEALPFPGKTETTIFMCSIMKHLNISQKQNFPMTQSAFK